VKLEAAVRFGWHCRTVYAHVDPREPSVLALHGALSFAQDIAEQNKDNSGPSAASRLKN
jgi:hypothetical protein